MSEKVKIKTNSNPGVIKILKKQARRRVEDSEWFVGELTTANVLPSKLGEPGDQYLQLDFKLIKSDENVCEDGKTSAAGIVLSGMYSLPPRVGNKTHKVLSAIIGHDLEQNEEVNIRAHLGKKFKVLIKDKQTMADDGKPWQKIEMVKSMKKVHHHSK